MAAAGRPHDSTSFEEEQPSPRNFGLTFAFVFVAYGLWPLTRGGSVRGWALVAAAGVTTAAFAAPALLDYPGRLWHRLGLVLHHIVNPVVMGFLFYAIVTPFGLLTRWRNPAWSARFRVDRTAPTYWIERSGAASSMERQF
jgi:hypothetical protein